MKQCNKSISSICEVIKNYRDVVGLSQTELLYDIQDYIHSLDESIECKLNQSSIAKLEAGDLKPDYFVLLYVMDKILKCDVTTNLTLFPLLREITNSTSVKLDEIVDLLKLKQISDLTTFVENHFVCNNDDSRDNKNFSNEIGSITSKLSNLPDVSFDLPFGNTIVATMNSTATLVLYLAFSYIMHEIDDKLIFGLFDIPIDSRSKFIAEIDNLIQNEDDEEFLKLYQALVDSGYLWKLSDAAIAKSKKVSNLLSMFKILYFVRNYALDIVNSYESLVRREFSLNEEKYKDILECVIFNSSPLPNDSSNSNIYILQDLIKKVIPVLKEPVNFLSVCYLAIHEYDKNKFLEQQAINGSPVKPVLNRIS